MGRDIISKYDFKIITHPWKVTLNEKDISICLRENNQHKTDNNNDNEVATVLQKGRDLPNKMAADCATPHWQPRLRWLGSGTCTTSVHNSHKAQPHVPHDKTYRSSNESPIAKQNMQYDQVQTATLANTNPGKQTKDGPKATLDVAITDNTDAHTDDVDCSHINNEINRNEIIRDDINEMDDHDSLSNDEEENQDNAKSWIASTRCHTSPADAITSCPIRIKDCNYTGTALFSPLNEDNDYNTLHWKEGIIDIFKGESTIPCYCHSPFAYEIHQGWQIGSVTPISAKQLQDQNEIDTVDEIATVTVNNDRKRHVPVNSVYAHTLPPLPEEYKQAKRLPEAERLEKLYGIVDDMFTYNSKENVALKSIMKKFPLAFSLKEDPLTITDRYYHEISIPHPIFTKQYPIPIKFNEPIEQHITSLLQ